MNKTQICIWGGQCDMAESGELRRPLNCANQRSAQGDRSRLKLAPTDVDLSQEQRIIQQRDDPLSRLLKHITEFIVLHRSGQFPQGDLAQTEDPVEWGT